MIGYVSVSVPTFAATDPHVMATVVAEAIRQLERRSVPLSSARWWFIGAPFVSTVVAVGGCSRRTASAAQ
jgi:hypothetical protein